MNKRVQVIRSYSVHLPEGRLGPIRDLYVDDRSMQVQALVVRSRPMLGREVVINPRHVRDVSSEKRAIHLNIDKHEVARLPDVEDVPSAADLLAAAMQRYTEVPVYWGGAGLWNGTIPADTVRAEAAGGGTTQRTENCHTQSLDAMTGYEVRTPEGALAAYLIDFVVDVENWALTYIVVEDLGSRVLHALDAGSLRRIDWYASAIECESAALQAALPIDDVLA